MALADEFRLGVDIHCDETDDEHSRFVEVMAAETIGVESRVAEVASEPDPTTRRHAPLTQPATVSSAKSRQQPATLSCGGPGTLSGSALTCLVQGENPLHPSVVDLRQPLRRQCQAGPVVRDRVAHRGGLAANVVWSRGEQLRSRARIAEPGAGNGPHGTGWLGLGR
jgi:hypothetical protein